MDAKTQTILSEMIKAARAGEKVYPFMWQPIMGRSNAVSAAIRIAKKDGLLIEGGKDGVGKPFYVAPEPKTTHAGSEAVN